MSFGEDEEILQDFLVEAGEILENLSEQLVELERQPDDRELLNSIFRGFHTVKGGAGFLQLNAMVDCCHVTESLFDILRNGQREVSAELMDIVLQALDVVNNQFVQLAQREEISPAEPELIEALERLVSGEDLVTDASTLAPTEPTSTNATGTVTGEAEITDEEFESLLDALEDPAPTEGGAATNDQPASPATKNSNSSHDISEDEFEDLLDQLHGKGQRPKVVVPEPKATANSNDLITDDEFDSLLDSLHGSGQGPAKKDKPKEPTPSKKDDGFITDNEFDDLLDQLHGSGKGPGTAVNKGVSSSQAKAGDVSPASPKMESVKRPIPEKTPPAKITPSKVAASKPAATKSAPVPAETTVRVDTQRLDEIMNMVGELVLVRNRLVRLGDTVQDEAMSKAVANLDVVTADLQTAVMKTRMQPIKKVFGRFPRVVRDLARSLKKEITLDLVGEETDLDKNLVEALADPLVHLVRNSVDHGVEMPDVRESTGKPRSGKIVLSAEQEGDHILLAITDDGAGMDPEKLRAIAVEKGLYDADTVQRLTDAEAFNLIFAPGFSTKKEISDVSGRGVGMDVVKTKISQLNGSIEIQSVMGEGTVILIKVPLTLAIMPTLMIMLANQTFALPLVSVNEIFHLDLRKAHVVDGQECIAIRDQAVPLFYLRNWLVSAARQKENVQTEEEKIGAHVVIFSVGTSRVGFVVDQLVGQEEVVIKPLGKMLQGTPGMSGATITGDGTIALILDVPSMLKHYSNRIST